MPVECGAQQSMLARIERTDSSSRQQRRDCGALRWKHLVLALSLYGSCSRVLQSRSAFSRSLDFNEVPTSAHFGHGRMELDNRSAWNGSATANATEDAMRETISSAPLQLLHEYIRQHSQAAIRSDSDHVRRRRRYAVAYYSCPHQAGNRLHHLFNSVIWSIVLNRTVLVHYYTQQACEAAGAGYDPGICRHANRQEDCDSILRRHSWIPVYDEWKDLRGLPNVTQRQWQEPMKASDFEATNRFRLVNGSAILQLNYWSTRGPAATSSRRPWNSSFHSYLHIDSRLADVKIVDFPQMLGQDAKLLVRGSRNLEQMLATEEARARARDLLSLGADYLYGMVRRPLAQVRRCRLSPYSHLLQPFQPTPHTCSCFGTCSSSNRWSLPRCTPTATLHHAASAERLMRRNPDNESL
jgi:hypothetical protein